MHKRIHKIAMHSRSQSSAFKNESLFQKMSQRKIFCDVVLKAEKQ